MSDNVGSVIFGYGMVENVGVRLNRSPISCSSKVISISGFNFRFRNRHFSFRCRPMSDNVSRVIFGSGMVKNVGVADGIASPSVSVQKLFSLLVSTSGFVANIKAVVGPMPEDRRQDDRLLRSAYAVAARGSRPSRLVSSVIFGLDMIENVG